MKIFNLTDVPTAVLEQRGLVNQHIAVGGRMCSPGEFVAVEDSATLRANVEDLVRIGALAIDQPPPPYMLARQQAEAASKPGELPVRAHIDMKETRVAGEPPPGPPAAAGEGVTAVLEKHDPTVAPAEAPTVVETPKKTKTGNR